MLGLSLLYLVPPLATIAGLVEGAPLLFLVGLATWLLMAATFLPTLALYRCNPLLALALPLAGTLYACMTFDSARRYYQGRGADWKGRSAAMR
jgi:hypothetical protein